MSTNELSFAMLGSTGAGKTTLLACMNKELERLNPGTFFPTDPRSFSTLNKAYNALKDEANDRTHYEFGVAVAGTEALSEYDFTIKGKSGSTQAKFYDFPGGWMNPEDPENFGKVSDILKKSMAVIAAVNTPYLMEAGGKHKDKAQIPEMTHLLKTSLLDSSDNKLFLIVPIKCEKYTRIPKDRERLQEVLSEAFREVFDLQDNPSYKDRLAIVMLPVHTAGNVYFSRFDNDGREIYTKNRNVGFSPQYVDQPLRYAMSFLLGTAPGLAADTGLSDAAEYIRDGMNLDDPMSRIVCGRDLILGQRVIAKTASTPKLKKDKEASSTTTVTTKPAKSGKTYTLAVMGATGAGKTVFLLSYFYSAMQLGDSTHTIAINDTDAIRSLNHDINELVNKGNPPIGTSQYNDMSFTVSGSMNVDLFDVPGGDTQGLAPGVVKRLRTADGAIFFIDGEDLVHNYDKVLQDNAAFGKAIAILRENTFRNISGRLLGREDVPIWFVITKGDSIPDVSDAELQERLSALLKNAQVNQGSGKWAEKLVSKGKRVKIFRTQSMGKWLSPTKPPTRENFNPINVTEAMDSMLDEMRKSQGSYSLLLRFVLGVLFVAGLGFTYYSVWQTDRVLWQLAMSRVDKAIVQENYSKARQEIDDFISPSYMGLYLKPIRADRHKDSEAYPKLEAALFAEITRQTSAINYNVLPEVSPSFLRTRDLVELYLDTKQFQTLAKKHYEHVKGIEWYFRAGSDYGYVPAPNATAEDVLKAVERCLNSSYKTPNSWREMERVKLEGMLREWVKRLPSDVDRETLDAYISTAEHLVNNPAMPDVLKGYLREQEARWNGLKSDQWRQAAEEWITEARKLPIQEAIRALNTHLAKSEISEPAKDRLRGAINELHVLQAEEWITEAEKEKDIRKGIARLNEHLAKNLVPDARSLLETGLVNLWNDLADDWMSEAANAKHASQGITLLKNDLAQEGIPEVVKYRLERGLENLQTREVDELVAQALALRDNGRVEEGLRSLQTRYEQENNAVMKSRLQREINSLRSWMVDSWINEAESQELDRGIADLTAHMKDETLTENDRIKIDDKIYDLERRLIVEWLNESQKIPAEDRISVLSMYYDKAPTENVRDRMQREIGTTYNEIIHTALNEYPDDVAKLRDLFTRLSRGRDIPIEVRNTLQNAINAATNKVREAYLRTVLQKIAAANSFDELARVIRDSDVDTNNETVQAQIVSTVQKLFGSEFTKIQNRANEYARAGRFSDARKYVESECADLRKGINSSVSGRSVNAIITQLETRQDGLLEDISAAHLRICRNSFNASKQNNSGVNETISKLNEYLSVWPDSREAETVSRVISYLHAVANGVSGYFTIVSGNFPNSGRTFDTPDIRVSVSGAVRINTPVAENQERPNFGYGASLRWTPNTQPIHIKAYEVDTVGDDLEVFNVTIYPSGWDGINRLTGNHSSMGNSIYTRFDGAMPSCPW